MAITALPVAPARTRPAEFADEGDAFLGALPNFAIEAEAARVEINGNTISAAASAAAALGAAESSGAVAWVSGTTYSFGDSVYSLIDLQTYRRSVAGAGTTDPSLDPTNWTRVSLVGIVRESRSSNVILTTGNKGYLIDAVGAWTQTFSAATTLGSGWFVYMRNTGNGDITLDPDASELIDGVATYTLRPGYSILLTCDGTGLNVMVLKARTYTFSQYTASDTFTVPADTYVIRPYAIGAGGTGTGAQAGGGGGCAFGDVAVTPGEVVTVTIAAGVATVTTDGVVRVTGNPASGITAGTASKDASVTNGGAYSGGAGIAGPSRGGASSGSPLGTGVTATAGIGGAGWGGAGSTGGGGGAGSAATSVVTGRGLSLPSIDPLLAGCEIAGSLPFLAAVAASPGIGAAPGGGGGSSLSATASHIGGAGGFGAGGGGGGGTNNSGGTGGFGGGGGGKAAGGTGAGVGGYGGGGGCSTTAAAAGGDAVVRIYY